MKLPLILALALAGIPMSAFAQAKLPYETILKASTIRKPVTVDGKEMLRIWVKAADEKTTREEVVFRLMRGDSVLSVIRPELADYTGLKDDSLSRQYPWQILVPYGTEFLDCALEHNQPKGSISLGFTAEFQMEDGELKIQNK